MSGFIHSGRDLKDTTLAGDVLKYPYWMPLSRRILGRLPPEVVGLLRGKYCERYLIRHRCFLDFLSHRLSSKICGTDDENLPYS